MSEAAVAEILARALRDRAFAEQLRADPDGATGEYDLTDAERAAIREGSRDTSGSSPLEERPHLGDRLL